MSKYIINYLNTGNFDVREESFIVLLRQYEQIGKSQNKHLSTMLELDAELFAKAQAKYDAEGYEPARAFLAK